MDEKKKRQKKKAEIENWVNIHLMMDRITGYATFMPHYTRTDYSSRQSKKDSERPET